MRRCTYIYIYIQEEIIIYIIYFVYIYYRHLYTSCIYNTYTHITIYRIICSILLYILTDFYYIHFLTKLLTVAYKDDNRWPDVLPNLLSKCKGSRKYTLIS